MLLAATNTKALWYLTRSTGLVTLILLTASVALGVAQVNRWASPRWPRFITAALHKNISLLVTVFLGVHIVTAVTDSFAPIRWLDVFVPMASKYRPIWLGLGAFATDLLIAIIITSLVRLKMGYRAWKIVHWTTYACWPVAFLHGLGTGSDTRRGWALLVQLGCLAVVLASVWWRLGKDWAASKVPVRLAALGASIAVPLAMLAFLAAGPLRPGWAARAGTPTALLAKTTPAAAGGNTGTSGTAPRSSATALAIPFSAQAHGTLNQTGADASGTSTVIIDLTLEQPAANLHVTLRGVALDSGGIQMTASAATLGPPSQPNLYQGVVTALAGTDVQVGMRDGAGDVITVTANLQIDQSNRVTGVVQAQPASAGR